MTANTISPSQSANEKSEKNFSIREFEKNLRGHFPELVSAYEKNGESGMDTAIDGYLPAHVEVNSKINAAMNRVRTSVRKEVARRKKEEERAAAELAKRTIAAAKERKQKEREKARRKIMEAAEAAVTGGADLDRISLPEFGAFYGEDVYVPPGFKLTEFGVLIRKTQFIGGEWMDDVPVLISPAPLVISAIVRDEEKNEDKWRISYLDRSKTREFEVSPAKLKRKPEILLINGISCDEDDISRYLFSFAKVNFGKIPVVMENEGMDAFSVLKSWYHQNKVKFGPKNDRNFVPWGRFSAKDGIPVVYVLKNMIIKMIEDEGFVWNKILYSWRKSGYIITENNKSTHHTTISGSKVACLAFRCDNLETLDDFEKKRLQQNENKEKSNNNENYHHVNVCLWPVEKTKDPGAEAIIVGGIAMGMNEEEARQKRDTFRERKASQNIYTQYSAVGKAWLEYENKVDKIKFDDIISISGVEYRIREIYQQSPKTEKIDKVFRNVG